MVEGLFRNEMRSTLKAELVHPEPDLTIWRVVPFGGVDRETLQQQLLKRGRDLVGEGMRAEVELVTEVPPTLVGQASAGGDTRGK
jgi:hypothetical protein